MAVVHNTLVMSIKVVTIKISEGLACFNNEFYEDIVRAVMATHPNNGNASGWEKRGRVQVTVFKYNQYPSSVY